MKPKTPQNFEYHRYLQKVLGANEPAVPFYIATEKDFARGGNIDYPYRSYFYVIALMHKGDCKLKVGINEYDLVHRTLSVVGPGIVRSWVKNDWRAINHTIFFKPDFFTAPFSHNFLSEYPFFKPGANHAFQLIKPDYEKALNLIELLQTHSKNTRATQGLFFALLEFVTQVYSVVSNSVSQNTRTHKISNQFARLLQSNYQAEKEVSFYAESLNLAPKTLSDILKRETGATAKQAIEEYIMFEAKCLLKQTNLSIKEIVYWLGYEDPSYFTKLFKNKTGKTPQAYRDH